MRGRRIPAQNNNTSDSKKGGKEEERQGLLPVLCVRIASPGGFFYIPFFSPFASLSLSFYLKEREREMRCCHTPTVHTERESREREKAQPKVTQSRTVSVALWT